MIGTLGRDSAAAILSFQAGSRPNSTSFVYVYRQDVPFARESVIGLTESAALSLTVLATVANLRQCRYGLKGLRMIKTWVGSCGGWVPSRALINEAWARIGAVI